MKFSATIKIKQNKNKKILFIYNFQLQNERLRQFEMNGEPQPSFEETIQRVSRRNIKKFFFF